MPSPRNAPRRRVVNVTRVGDYGGVRWVHRLDCGHSAVRKRRGGVRLGCVECLGAREFESFSRELVKAPPPVVDDGLAEAEVEAARLRALVAGRLGVPQEQVEVVIGVAANGRLGVRSGWVWLSASQLRSVL